MEAGREVSGKVEEREERRDWPTWRRRCGDGLYFVNIETVAQKNVHHHHCYVFSSIYHHLITNERYIWLS